MSPVGGLGVAFHFPIFSFSCMHLPICLCFGFGFFPLQGILPQTPRSGSVNINYSVRIARYWEVGEAGEFSIFEKWEGKTSNQLAHVKSGRGESFMLHFYIFP